MENIIISALVMGGVSIALSVLLVLANRKLFVREDPRIENVEDMLPHTNCGACGFPGCRAFAEALVNKKVLPGSCTVSSEDERVRIAQYLDIDVGHQEKRVARLSCAGGANVAKMRAEYRGLQTCRAAALVAGGGRKCAWSCLGLGDCEKVCDFDAIKMNQFGLPVVDIDKCTACNDCVVVCPKDLFSIQPISHRLWVACKNLEEGDIVLDECEVGCTACGRCAKDAPEGLISMKNNLPVIDYSKKHNTKDPIRRCPTGAIVWFEKDGSTVKGEYSKKIIRKERLPIDAT